MAPSARLDVQQKPAHALEQDRPDVLNRRQAWLEGQLDLDRDKLVFTDEAGLSTKMARRRGRASRGERCRSSVPHGHWKTASVDALRLAGMTATFVYDGAMNGTDFLAYVAQVLVPPFRRAMSSSWTLCRATRLKAFGRPSKRLGLKLRFLPPYPPDSNPIENAIRKLKALLRGRAERTVDAF